MSSQTSPTYSATNHIPAAERVRKQDPRPAISRRKTSVVVGVLFFVQMITAMIGTSLIQAFTDGDTDRTRLTVGVLLMICSGIAVVGIGVLLYPILKPVNRRLALWYPVLRVTEFSVSTACGVYLLAQLHAVPNHLLWTYIPTGLGGLVLNYLLFVSKLVPTPIAALGLLGYLSLTIGVPLTLLGVDINTGPGMLLLIPGFLFEFVAFPIWLLAKGFAPPMTQENAHRSAQSR